jgi:hypothetical protein
MTTPTEMRNLILETIGQLGKFLDVMGEYEDGYSDNDVKLLRVLHSFANQTKSYGKNLIAVNKVTDETIPK